ncbi:MAG: hypothetical protein R3B45_15955 [Bdellovibrionota bacterium]
MHTPFETATRVAIEEIILERMQPSKFGYFATHEAIRDLTDDIYELLKTSRSLKAAGDRMLSTAAHEQASSANNFKKL